MVSSTSDRPVYRGVVGGGTFRLARLDITDGYEEEEEEMTLKAWPKARPLYASGNAEFANNEGGV